MCRRHILGAPLLIVLALSMACPTPALAELDARIVEEILFNGQPRPTLKKIARWDGKIRWAAAGQRHPPPMADIREAIAEINAVISDTGVMIEEAAPGEAPQIAVSYLPRERIQSLQGSSSRAEPGRVGHSIAFPGPNSLITFGAVAVADDLSPGHLKYVILHEFLHVLGVAKHTTYIADSVMRQGQRPETAPTELQPFDRMLLRFIYTEVEPGATREKVRRAWESRPR
jgi:hypothetical protein